MENPTPTRKPMKRVFIIDDEAALADVYCDVLRSEGMEASSAGSGEEALGRLAAMEPPDLILLDFSMPAMNGPEFLSALEARRPEVLRTSVIVGFSSYPPDVPWMQQFGGSLKRVVQKPYDLDRLVDMVKALVA